MSAVQGTRPSLMRRVALFVSKPYLDWSQTAYPLSPDEDESLRSAFTTQRLHVLDSVERNRDLKRLRLRLLQRPVGPYADGLPQPAAARTLTDAAEPFEDFAQTQPLRAPRQVGASADIAIDLVDDEATLAGTLTAAAFAFAAGDAAAAEAKLLQGLDRYPDDAAVLYAHLLDLFRAQQQHDKFASTAHLFSRATGRPAPLWRRARALAPSVPTPGYALVVSTVLDAATATRLLNQINSALSAGRPYCLDLREVRVVEERACWPLAALLNRLANLNDEVPVAGLMRLATALAQATAPGEPACDRERARLALHRLTGDAQAYARDSDTFSGHCRLPAPDWVPPRCVLVQPPHVRDVASDRGLGTHHIALGGVLRLPALQALLRSHDDSVHGMHDIVVDCEALRRLDVDAAAALAAWAEARLAQGQRVRITQLSHLHHRLLDSLGMAAQVALSVHSDYATQAS
ncbi:MAG: STAS domain-containing protein [Betaproteobacteria bacterium]|nr:STAS domain-containing protein [Betaproteobacteria bacterium]